ncbi:DNA invertase Pin-like site-specific DNA recombinase [Rhizobium sp. BK650]|uniref:recombinase family protein n=1 Tax=Rhizobium sp. BK650 TaxID=2586990 RepID=UPI001618FD50|nr:recombinase family protein [Rhizobium sp. BK650]MBB3656732.1 DNA invertase Pin-like site-specific DNA recombinase [Rhizobium sp. BK650]
MKKIGYGQVSTAEESPELQRQALVEACCDTIFIDTVPAGINPRRRPEMKKVLDLLEPGDQLVVWKLDRLSRSVVDIVLFIDELREKGIDFASLTQGIDTKSGGRTFIEAAAVLAAFEREQISERVKAGQAETGRKGGRRPKATQSIRKKILNMKERGKSTAQIALTIGLGESTVRRILTELKAAENGALMGLTIKQRPALIRGAGPKTSLRLRN